MISAALSISPLLYVLVPAAFLLGSVPFGILFTRNMDIDLRSTGSKNIGATNVLRIAGKKPALLTLSCDIIKGAIPVLICKFAVDNLSAEDPVLIHTAWDLWGGITGFSVVAGHIFSVFLSFKGGKGVATGLGVIAVYSPVSLAVLIVIWITVAIITKYSSLAAIVAFISLPFVLAFLDASAIRIVFGALLAVLIVYRHRSNIKGLLSGKESKIRGKS
jgi:glycerol-3-phosphate acyltransferase PlsY